MIGILESLVAYVFMLLIFMAASLMPFFSYRPSPLAQGSEMDSILGWRKLGKGGLHIKQLNVSMNLFGGKMNALSDINGTLKMHEDLCIVSLRAIQAAKQKQLDLESAAEALTKLEEKLEKLDEAAKYGEQFRSLVNGTMRKYKMGRNGVETLAKYASLLPTAETSLLGGLTYISVILGFAGTLLLKLSKRRTGLVVKATKAIVFVANLASLLLHLIVMLEVRSFSDPKQSMANFIRVKSDLSYDDLPSLLAPGYGALNVSLFMMLLVFTASTNFILKSLFLKRVTQMNNANSKNDDNDDSSMVDLEIQSTAAVTDISFESD